MLSTRKDRSLLFSVLILLDFAASKAFVEYLQRRVAWITPHSGWRSPMMAPMPTKTAGEKKDLFLADEIERLRLSDARGEMKQAAN